jgi:hypothetical protein
MRPSSARQIVRIKSANLRAAATASASKPCGAVELVEWFGSDEALHLRAARRDECHLHDSFDRRI